MKNVSCWPQIMKKTHLQEHCWLFWGFLVLFSQSVASGGHFQCPDTTQKTPEGTLWLISEEERKSLLENSGGISLVFVVCPILNTLLTYNIIIIYCYWYHHQTQFHKIPTFSKLLMTFSACGVVYSGTDTCLCLPLVFEIGGRFTSWTSFDAVPPLSWNDLYKYLHKNDHMDI